ncbi:MAG: hypothetical protein FJ042_05970 [Candidatus Cloacimonetes bacterium]|nr:hypothetical protein [Candidatus Cloacimonadota bacterium]
MQYIEVTVHDYDSSEYHFAFPRISNDDYDLFWNQAEKGQTIFSLLAIYPLHDLVTRYPEFIDAWVLMGYNYQSIGRKVESFACFVTAYYLGRSSLPAGFNPKKHRISWLDIDNRPFLRACHALATEYLDREMPQDALDLYLFLLSVNPNDNQGAREMICQCYLALKQYREFIALYKKTEEYALPAMDVSYALALHANGMTDDARSWIRNYLTQYRYFWKELSKKTHRKPSRMTEDLGFISFDGSDAAYAYWKNHHRYWSQVDGALDLVREVLAEQKKR